MNSRRALRMVLSLVVLLAMSLGSGSGTAEAQTQTDESYAEDVSPELQAARECLVTNIFYDTDVREVLAVIAAQCFVNIVTDETVSGIITVELQDVLLEDAMRRVLTPFGLTFKWMGNYYLVGMPRPENPSFPLLTQTELYRPRHIKATEVPLLLSTYYDPFVRVSRETNTLSISGSPDLLERIKADLDRIDQPPRQVMIEALVTETSADVASQLGISWHGEATKGNDRIHLDVYPEVPGDSAYKARSDRIGGVFESVGIESGHWVGDFRMRLDALVEEGDAKIRANPRIATLEGNKARIFIGREEYFSILSGSVSFAYAQLEVIKTGIILTITPYVSDDGLITLEVEPEVSDVIGSGSTGLPVTTKRSVTTKVRVNEGETVVIGGLQVHNELELVRKIPILGDIPILGALFRHTDKRTEENEVAVLITPRLWPTDADAGTMTEDTEP